MSLQRRMQGLYMLRLACAAKLRSGILANGISAVLRAEEDEVRSLLSLLPRSAQGARLRKALEALSVYGVRDEQHVHDFEFGAAQGAQPSGSAAVADYFANHDDLKYVVKPVYHGGAGAGAMAGRSATAPAADLADVMRDSWAQGQPAGNLPAAAMPDVIRDLTDDAVFSISGMQESQEPESPAFSGPLFRRSATTARTAAAAASGDVQQDVANQAASSLRTATAQKTKYQVCNLAEARCALPQASCSCRAWRHPLVLSTPHHMLQFALSPSVARYLTRGPLVPTYSRANRRRAPPG